MCINWDKATTKAADNVAKANALGQFQVVHNKVVYSVVFVPSQQAWELTGGDREFPEMFSIVNPTKVKQYIKLWLANETWKWKD